MLMVGLSLSLAARFHRCLLCSASCCICCSRLVSVGVGVRGGCGLGGGFLVKSVVGRKGLARLDNLSGRGVVVKLVIVGVVVVVVVCCSGVVAVLLLLWW